MFYYALLTLISCQICEYFEKLLRSLLRLLVFLFVCFFPAQKSETQDLIKQQDLLKKQIQVKLKHGK